MPDQMDQRLLSNVLDSNPLFEALPQALKDEVRRAFVLREAKPGELFLELGDKGDGLYILVRGRCLPFHPRVDGGETKHPEMKEGDVFGEISLLLGKKVTASVRALTSCTVLFLPREDFDRIVRANPAFRSELVQMGFERLQRAAKQLSNRLGHPDDKPV